MKQYRTLATVRLFTGKIGLTEDQVKWRMSCLSKIDDGIYEINSGVVFKAGELIGLEAAPKPLEKSLECLEPEKSEIEAEIKEEIQVKEKPVAKKRKYIKKKG
jgi:hypothetical protein